MRTVSGAEVEVSPSPSTTGRRVRRTLLLPIPYPTSKSCQYALNGISRPSPQSAVGPPHCVFSHMCGRNHDFSLSNVHKQPQNAFTTLPCYFQTIVQGFINVFYLCSLTRQVYMAKWTYLPFTI